jgi:hypothetical protein
LVVNVAQSGKVTIAQSEACTAKAKHAPPNQKAAPFPERLSNHPS